MALTIEISNREISPLPDAGIITGDQIPSSNQKGVITKLAYSHDQLKSGLEALETIFDTHDHDPANSNGPGGPPIGSDDEESILPGNVINSLIANLNVTGAKIGAGAVLAATIADADIDSSKLGSPTVPPTVNIGAGGSHTINHGQGQYVMRCVCVDNPYGFGVVIENETTSSFTVKNNSGFSLDVKIIYWG
jgi:hypothetical protein